MNRKALAAGVVGASSFVAFSVACDSYTNGSRVENICSSISRPKASKNTRRTSNHVAAELSKPPHAVLFINGKAGVGHRLLREQLRTQFALAVCPWDPDRKAGASVTKFIDSLARPQTLLQQAAQAAGVVARLGHSLRPSFMSAGSFAGTTKIILNVC